MSSVNTEAAAVSIEPDPPPKRPLPSPGLLWTNLFADSTTSNTPSSSPSYLEDGMPVVLAPKSVILQASSSWAGHLLCRFLGEPPSPAKFFNDLNRVWGKFGDISVRRFSSGVFLVHVPSSRTRQWILQTGLWSSGTVSFVVSEWTVNPSLAAPPKLTSATTVLTIREIPPQLWSHEAVARIAGGVAKLIPGTRASLPLSSLGTTTIRVIVPLGSPLPPSVLVRDSQGDSVLVSVSYGRLPHLCPNCNSYGHQSHRCPLRHSPASSSSPNPQLIVADAKPNSPQSNPNIEPVGSVLQQSVSMDIVPELSSMNTPLITSPLQAPEVVAQDIESDNMVCEELTSDCASDPLPVPDSSYPLLSESNQITQASPQVVPQPIQDPIHAPEVDAQATEIDGMACDELIAKCASDSHTSHSLSRDLRQVHHFSSKADPQLVQAPFCTSPSSNPSESLVENKQLTISHNDSSFTGSTESVSTLTSFSFPPPVNYALDLKTDHILPPQTQLPLLSMSSTDKKEDNRDKSKDKPDSNSLLRCKIPNHHFKPKGILEKRRKKAQNALLPDAEEVFECIQEMQSDKKDTTHYEALQVHKILRKLDSGTIEAQET